MSLQDQASTPSRPTSKPASRPITRRATSTNRCIAHTRELIASGAASRALKAGDKAPAFTLKDPDGKAVSSADLLARGPLVVTFYRGVWCPYCNMELQALQAALAGLRGARRQPGRHLAADRPQQPEVGPREQARRSRSCRTRTTTSPHAFGIRFTLPDYLIDLYANVFKNDLPGFNGDPSWTLPMPARYVIGQDGVIAYAEVNPDYTKRPDPSELLPALRSLRERQAA